MNYKNRPKFFLGHHLNALYCQNSGSFELEGFQKDTDNMIG